MSKRFLDGLVFGAGLAVAFLVVTAVTIRFVFPVIIGGPVIHSGGFDEISTAPSLEHSTRFLGASASYSGDFAHGNNTSLSSGPGKIIGTAKVNGQPATGLKLRLALNGKVMSQWATTDSEGRYIVRVPYGEYRVDGFDLDRDSANSVLTGKIGHPGNPISSGTFDVADGVSGRGLNLDFVDPVILDTPKKRFSTDEEIVVRWHAYPGARSYSVQIFERPDPNSHRGNRSIIPWSDRPVVTEPSINLGEHNIELKPGHFYTVAIDAMKDEWQIISRSAQHYSSYDFEIVE